MRLRTKGTLFYATYLAGGFVVMYLSIRPSGRLLILPLLLWFLAFGLLQFRILRCPFCGELAIRTKRGLYVPATGSVCRYCDKL